MATQSVAPNTLGTLQALLEKYKGQIAMALPRHLTPERMIRIAITAVSRTPALQECTPLSIAGCVVQAAQLGLEPDGVLGEAYLVPFKNRKTGKKEAQLIPGYQGLLKLVRNSGELQMVNAQVVRENDRFDFEDGLDPYLVHKRAQGERGKITAYWAGAVLKGGGKQFVVMTRPEVQDHRDRYSKAKDSGPWQDEFDAMAMKTCLRKLCKLLPKSVQAQMAVALDERAEVGLAQRFSVDVPIELHPAEEEEPAAIQKPQRKSAPASAPIQALPIDGPIFANLTAAESAELFRAAESKLLSIRSDGGEALERLYGYHENVKDFACYDALCRAIKANEELPGELQPEGKEVPA